MLGWVVTAHPVVGVIVFFVGGDKTGDRIMRLLMAQAPSAEPDPDAKQSRTR